MIKLPIYFPPYEDELLYGWFFRLRKAMHVSVRRFRQYFFMDPNGTPELIQSFNISGMFWVSREWERFPEILDILFRHSTVTLNYDKTLPLYVGKKVLSILYNRGVPLYDTPSRSAHFPKLCPECMREDRAAGREPYIRTWHCGQDVTVCKKHKCNLHRAEFYNGYYSLGTKLDSDEGSYAEAEHFYKKWACAVESSEHPIRLENEHIDECTLLMEFGPVVLAKCNRCGLEFFTTRYMLELGRSCPECELKENVPQNIISKINGYVFVKNIEDINEKDCIRHDKCGSVLPYSANEILYGGSRCKCERERSDEELKKDWGIGDDYTILGRKHDESGRILVTVKHNPCGEISDKGKYFFDKGCQCRCERLKLTQEMIDERYSIDDPDWEIMSGYRDARKRIHLILKHIPCGREYDKVFWSTNYHYKLGCVCDKKMKKTKSGVVIKKKTYTKKYLIEHYQISDEFDVLSWRKTKGGDIRITVKHKTCGCILERNALAFKKGIKHKCRAGYTEETLRKKYGIGEDYLIRGWDIDEKGGVTLKLTHLPCGKEYSVQEHRIRHGWRCRCAQSLTEEELREKYQIPDSYEIYSWYRKEITGVTIVKGKHKPCGCEFEKMASVLKKEECAECDSRRRRAEEKANFEKKVSKLVGDEYVLAGEYHGIGEKVPLYHSKCGRVVNIIADKFLDGARCSCEKRIEKVDIDRYLDSFEPNFTIEKVKSGYKVTFKDSGNEVTMQARRIRQEATCLCEPTYFTRKKKS